MVSYIYFSFRITLASCMKIYYLKIKHNIELFLQVEVIQSAIKYIKEGKALRENLLAGNSAQELSKINLSFCIISSSQFVPVYVSVAFNL